MSMLIISLPKVVIHVIQSMQNKLNFDVINLDTMQALHKLSTEITTKTARMINLLKVKNYDTKIILRKITLAACFYSKQVFPAPKQTKK